MNSWFYNNRKISCVEDLPNHENLYGFIYMIQDTETLRSYVGKKVLYNTRKKKISQKVKKATGTRKTFEYQVKESDWQIYHGSSKELLADITKYGAGRFRRVILELCCTKKYLSYAELAWQIKLDVLKSDSYNGNILGRYYTRDMQNCSKK
jgi:hypothetical protein